MDLRKTTYQRTKLDDIQFSMKHMHCPNCNYPNPNVEEKGRTWGTWRKGVDRRPAYNIYACTCPQCNEAWGVIFEATVMQYKGEMHTRGY